jgi:hypothetical protein
MFNLLHSIYFVNDISPHIVMVVQTEMNIIELFYIDFESWKTLKPGSSEAKAIIYFAN